MSQYSFDLLTRILFHFYCAWLQMLLYYLVVNHTKSYQKEDVSFFYYLHVNGAEPPVKGPVCEGQHTLVLPDK